MSLRDQLLKAGVVTEDQVKASEVAEEKAKQARKAKFQQRKNQPAKGDGKRQHARGPNKSDTRKGPAGQGGHKADGSADSRNSNKNTNKSAASKPANSKIPTGPAKAGSPARKAQLLAIKHLITQNRLNDESASEVYNFVSAKKVRKVRVTAAQTEQLAKGELALIRNPQDSFDFVILPIDIAKEIAQTETNVMLVLNDGSMPEDDLSTVAAEATPTEPEVAVEATSESKPAESDDSSAEVAEVPVTSDGTEESKSIDS